MEIYVRFCNEPKEWPIEVLSVIALRSEGMIGIKIFYREMKKFGISRTKALIYQGCYERGEFVIVDEEGRELKDVEREIRKTPEIKIVRVYEFTLLIKLSYEKKGHNLIIEIQVDGRFEKTDGIPFPADSEMMDTLRSIMLEKFDEFMVDFFTHKSDYLRELIGNSRFEAEFDRFEVVDRKVKPLTSDLEGEITYVSFYVGRMEGKLSNRTDLANAFEKYAEEGLIEFLAYVIDTEATYMTITARRIARNIMKAYEESSRKLVIDKLKEKIITSKNVSDINEAYDLIRKAYEEGKINYDTYVDLVFVLQVRAREILANQLMKWIERIDKCKKLSELNDLMSRIYSTVTYRSPFFDPFRHKLEEEYIRKFNELARIELKKEIITLKDVYKMIVTNYLQRLSNIVEMAEKHPHMIRRAITQINRILRRLERTKLPDYVKAEIISEYQKKIEKIIEYACKKYKEQIDKANTIEQLENLRSEIKRNRKVLEICYDKLMDKIKRKIKELRSKLYKERIKEILSATAKELKELQYTLYSLPVKQQIKIFKELINKADNVEFLEEVREILLGSEIAKNPKYYNEYAMLVGLIRKRRGDLLWKV